MNSLKLYYSLRKKYLSSDSIRSGHKLADVDKIIRQVYDEIFNPPFWFKDSPFIYAMINMIKQKNSCYESFVSEADVNEILVVDAYIITQGLMEYIVNLSFTATDHFQEYEKYLFSGEMFKEKQMLQMKDIDCKLQELKKKINEKKSEFNSNKKGVPEVDKLQTYSSGDINRKNIVTDEVNQQLFMRSEARRKQNDINIQLWHDEQAGISVRLMEMQPSITQLLEKFMSFSDNITNQYVLQFAKMQVELFDFMSEIYSYHIKKIEFSENQDYVNAVLNYKDFMDSICDNLAVFGIEEICSKPGTCFDGMIHEPNICSFSSKTALIEESIRTGFKYKDVIIQKEKIKIKE